ncbi:MAG: putative pyoverdin transport system ATP-binding/permease protein, partial [Acidobacteriota bacterium]|nr:putative pyoverdin transport system ATP-binding/permease protein [Acidobacteriota bacterium]
MTLLKFLLRSSRSIALLAIVGGLTAGACNSALVAYITRTVTRSDAPSAIWIWGFVGLCLLLPLTRFLSSALLVKLSQKGVHDLRMHLSGRILAAPLRKLEEVGPARLLGTLTDDVRTISIALIAIPATCIQISIVLSCLAYLCWLSWPAFLGLLVLMVISLISIQLPVMKSQGIHRQARELQDVLFKHLRALTDGNKELKLHSGRRRAFLSDSLGATSAESERYTALGSMLDAATGGWSQLVFFGAVGGILFVLPRLVPMSTEVRTGYILTMMYMMVPIDVTVGALIPTMVRANVALRKIESLGLSLEEASRETPTSEPRPAAWRRLELAGATHTFTSERENETFELGPIDLAIHPGEVVFIIGGNGSGKTTLAKLLAALYVPEAGELRLDGELIADANRDSYRQHFAVVFSDFYLFDTLLGIEAPELDARAREYLVKLQLDGKVEIKGGALSTLDLSQGQRKRLALLTAYLEDRDIYLFDEWAADQDPLFKQTFYYQLIPELKARGKTVLVISHDDHYYHLADRVIKLVNGR